MQVSSGSLGAFDRKSKISEFKFGPGFEHGFTLIELMIVTVIVAIIVTLAVPTFKASIEKRRVVSAAEGIASFIGIARGEAIKRSEQVSLSWSSPGGHNVNWCIGAALITCDCTETDPTEADFCSIDSIPYRLTQSDFADMSFEFLHMQPIASSFAFDPVRGIPVDVADAETVDGDWLFYVHSDAGTEIGGKRLFELQLSLNATGKMSICADDDRFSIIAGYPIC